MSGEWKQAIICWHEFGDVGASDITWRVWHAMRSSEGRGQASNIICLVDRGNILMRVRRCQYEILYTHHSGRLWTTTFS